MKLNDVSLNEKFFEGWNLEQLKEYYGQANLKATGLTVEKLAEKLGIKKATDKPEQ